jgi:ubiquinone/menaquinone biosynthesis C-methylase UbiE
VKGNEVGAYFDETADAYDSAYAATGAQGRVLRRRAEAAIRLLGSKTGDVLDAGMGGGVLLTELDRRGWRVSGIDLAPAMVARAQERLPHARDRLLEASIEELPFADASFDAVVATGVLEYTAPDLDRSVGELVRVLRPNGAVVASFPNYRAPATLWRAHVHYPLVRLAKRRLASRRPPPPRMPTVQFSDFLAELDRQGLVVEVVEPVSARRVPRRLAVQYVLRARKVAQ